MFKLQDCFLKKHFNSSGYWSCHKNNISTSLILVPEAGLEPARYFYRGILSPLCLPIPPLGLVYKMITSYLYFVYVIKQL